MKALHTVLLLGGLLVGCGGGEAAAEEDGEYEDLNAPVVDAGGQPVAKQSIDPAATGTVRGTCVFEGEPPELKEFGLAPECPEHAEPVRQEHVLVKDGRLKDVLVSVKKGLAGWEIPPAAPGEHVLDQVGCVYTPHVSAMRAGQTLKVRNSDPLTHNVNISAKRNNLSKNVTQGRGGDDHVMEPKRRERIDFKCDIHPWMSAHVFVQEHPFYALTGEDGAFEIAGLPPGEYELEALHSHYRSQKAKVTVTAGGVAETTFTYSE